MNQTKMAQSKPWNPMEDSFKNPNLNKYEQGPGAALDPDLQPGAVANSGPKKYYQLVFRSVPEHLNQQSLLNLCMNYGKCLRVRDSPKNPYYFADFVSLNEMERVLSGLQNNEFNMIVEPARRNNDTSGSVVGSSSNASDMNITQPYQEIQSMYQQKNGVDFSKRSILGPFTNPPRPSDKLVVKNLVTEKDYENSNLQKVDPKREFLVKNDMHHQDRNISRKHQIKQQASKNLHNNRQSYTGRSFYEEPRQTTDNIRKKANASEGKYNKSTDELVKKSRYFDENVSSIGKCLVCNKEATSVCQRCGDFYCSKDCQKKDWQKHRYICFAMPELVSNNSPQVGKMGLPKDTPNLTKNSAGPSQKPQFTNGVTNEANSRNNRVAPKINDTIPLSQQNGSATHSHQQQQYNKQLQHKSNHQQASHTVVPQKFQQSPPKPQPPKKEEKLELSQNSGHGSSTSNKDSSNKIASTDIVPKSAEFPKSGSLVGITSVLNTRRVFIRSLAPDDNVYYTETLQIVHREAKNAQTVTEMPTRGTFLIAEFENAGFYRVIVMNPMSKDSIHVAYIDFGNTAVKKLSELKELSEVGARRTRHALSCYLKGVPEFEQNEKVKTYMESFPEAIGKNLKIIYGDRTDDTPFYEVELIDTSNNENINKKILELKEVPIAKLNDAPVFVEDIDMKLLPAGVNMPLIITDKSLLQSTGCISCIHKDDFPTLDSFNKQINEYAAKAPGPYTPRVDEICLVKYDDDQWYRAACIEVAGDGHPSVHFIDYGNVSLAPIERIRKYPRDLIYPCFTSQCIIERLPEDINDKLAKRLDELIKTELTFDKVSPVIDDEINRVRLDSVIKTLEEEEYI